MRGRLLPRRVPAWRFALGTTLLLAACGKVAWIGGTLPWPLAATAAVLFTVPLCSLGEWLVHGIMYHGRLPLLARIRTIHHDGHHFALFPPERYVQDGPTSFMRVRAPMTPFRMAESAFESAVTMGSQVALHFAVGIPLVLLPAWALSRSGPFLASSVATLALVSWLLAYVHGAIHTPRGRFIERQAWFRWLDHHHYVHHVDVGANINFMLPLCDLLFGTQRGSLTESEARRYPPFASAKAGTAGRLIAGAGSADARTAADAA